jgi:acetylornithine deacetylase/succinyl-diaminopimelate desuccinylase-like protein
MPNFRLLALACAGLCTASAADLDRAAKALSRDIFRELIEINTTDSVGSTTLAANAMAKRLLDAGFPAADVVVAGPNERKGNLVVRLRGTGADKPILILGHLDVVEARRADWTTDPFQFVEKDGYFYGRGTQDIKCEDAVLVTDFIRFRKEGFRPNRDLILALTADEEGGKSNGVDWLLKNRRELIDAEYVLNADAGGVTTRNGRPVNIDVEAAEKVYADFPVTATNPGGHSSLPRPDNAIYHVVDALARLERHAFPMELNPVTRTYFERRAPLEDPETAADMNGILRNPPDPAAVARLSKDPRYNSMLRTTCVATRLAAGHANNALPQSAQANVNCRILPGHSMEEVRQELVRIFTDPEVTVGYQDDTGNVAAKAPEKRGFPPLLPPARVLDPLTRVAAEIWPGAPVIPEMDTGASDSIYTRAEGIPSYGVSGIAIDQDDVRAHGKDERVRVSSFYDGVEFHYRFLKALTSNRDR